MPSENKRNVIECFFHEIMEKEREPEAKETEKKNKKGILYLKHLLY